MRLKTYIIWCLHLPSCPLAETFLKKFLNLTCFSFILILSFQGAPGDDDYNDSLLEDPTAAPTEVPSTEPCHPDQVFDAVTSLRGETIFFKDR